MKSKNKFITVNIFNESIRKKIPKKRIIFTIERIFKDEKIKNATVNIIFVNNEEIKKINKKYLNHNYATDVISFCLEKKPLEGEIYISAEIAKTNAIEFLTNWTEEIVRYVIHGILHLLDYEDFYFFEKEKMRKLEEKYLAKG
jgi:rRNA maturation RNase YbeY